MFKPTLTGPYAVGTMRYSIVDDTRTEQFGESAGCEPKRIPAFVYYPVKEEDTIGCDRTPLMTREVAGRIGKRGFAKLDYDKMVADGELAGLCYTDASVIRDEKFPLILFHHGYGACMHMQGDSFLLTELASHGYYIISIGHPYESEVVNYEDGTIVFLDESLPKRTVQPMLKGNFELLKFQKAKGTPEELYRKFKEWQDRYCSFVKERQGEWVRDSLCILEDAKVRFANEIDFSRGVGASGHSMGGSIAYALCQHVPEIACGINIDGGLFGDYDGMTMKKPFFQICSESNVTSETKPLLDRKAPVYRAIFKKNLHMGFSDLKYLADKPMITGKMPASVMHENLCKCHVSFFDRYLKGKSVEISIQDEWIVFEEYSATNEN